jgi:hypothetical protein
LSGYVITLFDPVLHRPLAEQPDDLDARWVLCHRPSVTVGGELVSEMLELRVRRFLGRLRRAAADEGQQRHLW